MSSSDSTPKGPPEGQVIDPSRVLALTNGGHETRSYPVEGIPGIVKIYLKPGQGKAEIALYNPAGEIIGNGTWFDVNTANGDVTVVPGVGANPDDIDLAAVLDHIPDLNRPLTARILGAHERHIGGTANR